MSDIEEPPSKVLKLEMSDGPDCVEEHLETEEDEDNMEEGQEEWLSEGVLTDDDYNPGADQDTMEPHSVEMLEDSQTADEDATPSLESSTEQAERVETLEPEVSHNWHKNTTNTQNGLKDDSKEKGQQKAGVNGKGQESQSEAKAKKEAQDIEDTLNNLDRTNELPDELDAFLIRKSDGLVVDKKVKPAEEAAAALVEDDGNDTDDLLRMLGEDDSKVKKKVLVKKSSTGKNDMLSSDDEFTYENTKVRTLQVAKNLLMKKRPATKAVPEVMSDESTDVSSDEAATMKKMFAAGTKKPAPANNTGRTLRSGQAKVADKPAPTTGKIAHSTPLKQYVNKNLQVKPASKPAVTPPVTRTHSSGRAGAASSDSKPPPVKPDTAVKTRQDVKSKDKEDKPSAVKDVKVEQSDVKIEVIADVRPAGSDHHEEIIDEEEFLEEEEDFELDEEEFAEDSEPEEGSLKQRIMRPERMDEEVPTDGESYTEDGSLYDEIPSSDSEDMDDWFSLDVRSERASDYLPLLGSRARALLLAERRAVWSRVRTLRHSLCALTDSGRRQADQLRRATITLAELDDMLKAT